VKGTTTGTITDNQGNFIISDVPLNSVVVFSFVGMKTREIVFSGQSEINVILEQETIGIEELVVIGYGYVKKDDLTGAVSSVKGENLKNIPAARLEQMLQGRIAGVQVTQTSGEPGAASIIRIRGGNSIQGDNDPLYVVDGFIMGTGYNLNNLNPNDIKSVNALKDATSIAIYGTRGANGVVLITTKSGSQALPGKPIVSFNTYSGVQLISKTVELMDGPELAAWVNEYDESTSSSLTFPTPDSYANTDWIDEITRNAPVYNADISISGQSSDQKTDYYVSANYFNQEGLIKNSGFERYTFNTKINIDLSDKIRMGLNLNSSRSFKENNKVNYSNVYLQVLTTRAIYDENGEYTALNPVNGSNQRNPVADIELREDHTIRTNLFGSVFLEVEPIKNLVLRSTFGPEINSYKDNIYNPGSLPQNRIINAGGDGSVSVSSRLNLLNENTVTYSVDLGKGHQINLLGGFTWQTEQSESVYAAAYGFSNDALNYNNLSVGSDPTRNVVGSGWDNFQLVSWLARANYSFKDKYLLTLVGRVDGSSKFAKTENRYAFFPSAAIAWRLDQEEFIKNLNVFDQLKLRASYGNSGSQGIGSYRTLSTLSGTTAYFNDMPQTAVIFGRPANEDLKWETTQQLDIGLEFGFFEKRLMFEIDYYNKVTSDLLLDVQIPQQTGFVDKLQNLGSVRNQGIELMVNSVNISNRDFRWTTTLIMSGNRNEVLDLGGVDYIDIATPISGGTSGRLIVGQPAPVFVGVEYYGTWKSQEEIDASNQTGQIIGGPHLEDTNGDGTITEDDFHVIGSPQPDFFGSIQNTFSWKNFELDFFIQGTYGNDVFNTFSQSAYFGRSETNKYKEVLDRWTPDNQDSDIPVAGSTLTLASAKSNTQMVEDGSHLRLKNIRFTYNVPVKKLGLNFLQDLNVYLSGSNLFLISKFRLGDPEVNEYGTNNIITGFSGGEYPYGKTIM
ncbi:MAG: TonB-dependent receptor, partial [Bacteroidales bacterium]|nr:TonB-dependent receptor [Bacteroidales bacterium]